MLAKRSCLLNKNIAHIKKQDKKEKYSSLSLYFADVDRGNLLSKEEELFLARTMDEARYRDKNGKKSDSKLWNDNIEPETLFKAKKAREKLINSNLRLVASVAKKFQGKGCELEDLIQEGNIGLMDGIDRFDHSRNLKISTYCTWWIRQRIDRLISNHGRTVRVPVHVQTLASKLRNMIEEYREEFDCDPTPEEIKESLECSLDMAKAALLLITSPKNISIDQEPTNFKDNNDGSDNLHSYFEDKNATDPLDCISHQELANTVKEAISTLSERDEKILRLRFGIVENPEDHKRWPITKKELQKLKERKNGK